MSKLFHFDDEEFIEQIALEPNIGRDFVVDVLGDSAKDILERIPVVAEREMAVGMTAPVPLDPNLPEIVLLHGITDSHLAEVTLFGRHNRIWLDYLELVKGKYTRRLSLQADGESDLEGVQIVTNGHRKKKYNPAIDAWQQAGIRTHVFTYDWRKSVRSAAEHLGRS